MASARSRLSATGLVALLVLGCGSSSSSSTPDASVDAAWPWATADGNAGSGGSGGDGTGGAGGTSGMGGTGGTGGTGGSAAADAGADASLPVDHPPGSGGDGSGNAACASRTGGAVITLKICASDLLSVWVTNSAFITEAIAKKGMQARIPSFELVDGRDCDNQYTWHVKPDTAKWVDVSAEVQDGCPHLVEADKASWLMEHYYAPWTVSVVEVVDRR